MRIRCVGGGPAGLMFAIPARSAGHQATVYEQVQPAESFSRGVVFSDGLLRQPDEHDAETGRLVRENAYTWTDQVVTGEGCDPVRNTEGLVRVLGALLLTEVGRQRHG